jgi:hypothetical protein
MSTAVDREKEKRVQQKDVKHDKTKHHQLKTCVLLLFMPGWRHIDFIEIILTYMNY